MFRLGICGDSWMSPVNFPPQYVDTHFSQLLCKEQNWQLEWYARPGSSNGGICTQIEQAINDKVDLILFGTTTYNRTEYSLDTIIDKDTSHRWEGLEPLTLENIAPVSEKYRHNNNNYEIISDNIIGILNKNHFIHTHKQYSKLSPSDIIKKYDVMRDWFIWIYHPAWKQKLDRWCLHAVCQKLRESEIPYQCVIDFIGMPDTYWIDQPILGEEWLQSYIAPDNGPGYHTTTDNQIRIKNLVKERLRNKGMSLVD